MIIKATSCSKASIHLGCREQAPASVVRGTGRSVTPAVGKGQISRQELGAYQESIPSRSYLEELAILLGHGLIERLVQFLDVPERFVSGDLFDTTLVGGGGVQGAGELGEEG